MTLPPAPEPGGAPVDPVAAPAQPVDLRQCDAEPIHLPGSIQPHGVLLALHGPELRITQASATSRVLLGVAVEELLGRELATAFVSSAGAGPSAELAERVREALLHWRSLPDAPASFSWCVPGDESAAGSTLYEGHVHESEALVVLELELASAGPSVATAALSWAVLASRRVRAQTELGAKLQTAAESVRELTGYDRVMVYRFHDDWHGEVVAEAAHAELEPYLGLHYPASDIPAQARRMYLVSATRVIVTIDYAASPLLPTVNPVTGRGLDLSRSVLRSVSPVHLEYLRNMGVGATMTASLVVDGRLWGLVSCHHHGPHPVPAGVRDVVDWISRELATQIALTEAGQSRRRAAQLKRCREDLAFAVRGGARLPELLRGPELTTFLAAVAAEGVALVRDGEVWVGGVTPEPRRILELVESFLARSAAGPANLFATDCLSQHLPETADLAPTAAGVGMFPLEAARPMRLLWFRGERLRLVKWGGNPDKAMNIDADGRLSPRRSFGAWAESVRLHSEGWQPEELESARELGSMIDLELRRIAEDGRRASEVLLRDVLDSLTAQIAVLDTRGVITSVNRAWRSFAERNSGSPDGAIGFDYLEACRRGISGPEAADARLALDGIREVLGGARAYFELEYPCDSPSEARWFVMRVFRLSSGLPGAVIAHEEITATKQAELARREAEERYRSIVTSMAEGVVLQDAAGTIVECNAAAESILGLTREQMAGRSSVDPGWRSIRVDGSPFPGDEHPAMVTLRTGAPLAGVVMGVYKPQGALTWISVASEPLRAAPGTPPHGVVTTFTDVTERRRMEEVLRATARQLSWAQELGETGSWSYDLATGLFRASPEGRRIFGLAATEESFTVEAIEACIPERARVRQALVELVEQGRDYDLEYAITPADGSTPKVIRSIGRLERDAAGRPTAVIGFLQDVTARALAEETLRQSEARFRQLFEGHSAVMLLIDPRDGTLVDANPAAVRFYGYERTALQRMNIGEIDVLPSEQIQQLLGRARRSPESTFLVPHRLASGEVRTVEVNVSPTEVEGQRLDFAIVQDVTEREQARRELGELNRSLEERVEQAVAELRDKDQLLIAQNRHAAMGEMIGNIAHQWRQPLNTLGLVLADLKDASHYGELDAAGLDRAVDEGTRLIQRMSTTITDFRNFFRPAKEKVTFSALAQVRETLALLEASFKNTGIVIDIDAPTEVSLLGPPNEYGQVLMNLFTNARQAIQGAGVAEGRMTIRVCERDGLGCLTVLDNGGGIPESTLLRLWEPYFTTKEGGTGLGLYMSKQIVERSLGGRLEARNAAGGAEFTVWTPLSATRQPSTPRARCT